MDLIVEYRKLGCPVTNCHNWIYDIVKWLRDEHKILIMPFCNSDNEGDEPTRWFLQYIVRYDNSLHDDAFICQSDEHFSSYEDVIEEALKLILNILND